MSPAAGANYRSVWAMQKHYPHVKTYVRAHDVNHGINLEKAGATVVVPEILEPSLQLAASVLSEFELPYDEVTNVLDQFRKKHLSELQVLAASTGETAETAEQRCRAEARAPRRGGRGGGGRIGGAGTWRRVPDPGAANLCCSSSTGGVRAWLCQRIVLTSSACVAVLQMLQRFLIPSKQGKHRR